MAFHVESANSGARLAVEGVKFSYPHFDMGPISFEAEAGQIFAIIGPNGSGKSTLLEIAGGHLKPSQGTVTLEGTNLHGLSPCERARRVGVARQDSPLLFSFEVREFIRQGRHPHLSGGLFESSEDERWVAWAAENASLQNLVSRRVTEISGGEFQRAVLARTLAQRPRLLLLDEPTANLDIRYQIEMLRMVKRLAASEGFAAVVVTHELNLAAELSDRLMLIEAGRAVCQGTAEEVLRTELVSRVFGTTVLIDQNPRSGRPRVTWVTP